MPIAQSKIIIDPQIDHIQGQLNAPIVLLEYGDFECPFCGKAHHVVKGLQNEFDKNLCFVFRHFPLSEIHPHAELAAKAAEAAGKQNKFWEMHDRIFEHQDALEIENLISYAEDLGLDKEQFQRDLESGSMEQRVRRDFLMGLKDGVNGTPTFFINGVRYNGPSERMDEIFHTLLNT